MSRWSSSDYYGMDSKAAGLSAEGSSCKFSSSTVEQEQFELKLLNCKERGATWLLPVLVGEQQQLNLQRVTRMFLSRDTQ